ncbi:MAG: hypothetical protein AAF456_01280 [Planctomycetota bacterium]
MFNQLNPATVRHPASRRPGITVIEVLTAMVVALIGVFGVMILIPFAVRQAESGLDLDNANRMARNGIANFEIGQFQSTARWTTSAVGTPAFSPIGVNAETTLWAIDPLRVTADTAGVFGSFPPELGSVAAGKEPLLQIPELNLNYFDLTNSQLQPFDAGMARRMFRSTDDLVFETSSVWEDVNADGIIGTGETRDFAQLDAPQQIYDVEPTTNAVLRRQALGEMSWMAIVQPYGGVPDAATNMFRMFTLVYKNRGLFNQTPDDPADNVVFTEVRQVQLATNPPAGVSPRIGFAGGTIQVDPAFDSDGAFNDARQGDWVMLVSGRETFAGSGIYRKQIGFYRIAADPFTDPPVPVGTGSGIQYLTLDGSDFNFDFGDPDPAVGPEDATQTYAVLLVGFDGAGERLDQVVNVYERTFRSENASNWNR